MVPPIGIGANYSKHCGRCVQRRQYFFSLRNSGVSTRNGGIANGLRSGQIVDRSFGRSFSDGGKAGCSLASHAGKPAS